MFKKIVGKILVGLVVFSSIAHADEGLKVMYVGAPQSGPPVILTQSFAQNLNVPNTFVSMKDCAGALKVIEQNPNVVFFVSDLSTLTFKREGTDCMPKFKPEDVIGTVASSWHVCKKAGGRDMGQQRFTFGMSNVIPVNGIAKDFNKRNGVNAVPVALASSSQVVSALLSGDIDWGMINPGVAEPLVQDGKLDCPLTFIPQGTALVGKNSYIANHYDMTIPDLRCTYLLVVKSKDPKVREAALKAAQSKGFAEFLDKTRYINIKSGNFTQADLDGFNFYINHLEKSYY
jgi:hypothetical protein